MACGMCSMAGHHSRQSGCCRSCHPAHGCQAAVCHTNDQMQSGGCRCRRARFTRRSSSATGGCCTSWTRTLPTAPAPLQPARCTKSRPTVAVSWMLIPCTIICIVPGICQQSHLSCCADGSLHATQLTDDVKRAGAAQGARLPQPCSGRPAIR